MNARLRRPRTIEQLDLENEPPISPPGAHDTPPTVLAERIFNDPGAWFAGSDSAKSGEGIFIESPNGIDAVLEKGGLPHSGRAGSPEEKPSYAIKPFTREHTLASQSSGSSFDTVSVASSASSWSCESGDDGKPGDDDNRSQTHGGLTINTVLVDESKPNPMRASNMSMSFFWSSNNIFRSLPSPTSPAFASPISPGPGFGRIAIPGEMPPTPLHGHAPGLRSTPSGPSLTVPDPLPVTRQKSTPTRSQSTRHKRHSSSEAVSIFVSVNMPSTLKRRSSAPSSPKAVNNYSMPLVRASQASQAKEQRPTLPSDPRPGHKRSKTSTSEIRSPPTETVSWLMRNDHDPFSANAPPPLPAVVLFPSSQKSPVDLSSDTSLPPRRKGHKRSNSSFSESRTKSDSRPPSGADDPPAVIQLPTVLNTPPTPVDPPSSTITSILESALPIPARSLSPSHAEVPIIVPQPKRRPSMSMKQQFSFPLSQTPEAPPAPKPLKSALKKSKSEAQLGPDYPQFPRTGSQTDFVPPVPALPSDLANRKPSLRFRSVSDDQRPSAMGMGSEGLNRGRSQRGKVVPFPVTSSRDVSPNPSETSSLQIPDGSPSMQRSRSFTSNAPSNMKHGHSSSEPDFLSTPPRKGWKSRSPSPVPSQNSSVTPSHVASKNETMAPSHRPAGSISRTSSPSPAPSVGLPSHPAERLGKARDSVAISRSRDSIASDSSSSSRQRRLTRSFSERENPAMPNLSHSRSSSNLSSAGPSMSHSRSSSNLSSAGSSPSHSRNTSNFSNAGPSLSHTRSVSNLRNAESSPSHSRNASNLSNAGPSLSHSRSVSNLSSAGSSPSHSRNTSNLSNAGPSLSHSRSVSNLKNAESSLSHSQSETNLRNAILSRARSSSRASLAKTPRTDDMERSPSVNLDTASPAPAVAPRPRKASQSRATSLFVPPVPALPRAASPTLSAMSAASDPTPTMRIRSPGSASSTSTLSPLISAKLRQRAQSMSRPAGPELVPF